MWFWLAFIIFYVVTGVLAYGRTFAHFEKQFPSSPIEDHRNFAIVIGLMGFVALFVALTCSKGSGCGFKFTDGCTWVRD